MSSTHRNTPARLAPHQLLALFLGTLFGLLVTLVLGILYVESRDATQRELDKMERDHQKRMRDMREGGR